MGGTAKEYIDSFIEDINKEINWKYLKSGRRLKKQIKDIVFQIDFYSSKFNGMDLRIEIRSECRVWCRKYGKALTIDNGIAFIPFLTDEGYWWDITSEENREIVFDLLKRKWKKIITMDCVISFIIMVFPHMRIRYGGWTKFWGEKRRGKRQMNILNHLRNQS